MRLNVFQRMDRIQTWSYELFGFFQFVGGLQIDPVLRRLPKNPPEPQRQFRGHRSRSIDHMGHTHRRNAGNIGEFDLRDAEILQHLPQENPRVERRHFLPGGDVRKVRIFQVFPDDCHDNLLMVIDNFDILGVTFLKTKADTPLPVDPDAPLSLSVPLQGFQIVRSRNAQVFDSRCRIDLSQSVTGASLNFDRKCPDEKTGEEGRRAFVCKGDNHEIHDKQIVYF